MRHFLLAALLFGAWQPHALANDEPEARRVVDLQIADSGAIQRLTLTDGSQLFGRIEAVTPPTVVFRSIIGATVTLTRAEIVDLRIVQGSVVDGEFRPDD